MLPLSFDPWIACEGLSSGPIESARPPGVPSQSSELERTSLNNRFLTHGRSGEICLLFRVLAASAGRLSAWSTVFTSRARYHAPAQRSNRGDNNTGAEKEAKHGRSRCKLGETYARRVVTSSRLSTTRPREPVSYRQGADKWLASQADCCCLTVRLSFGQRWWGVPTTESFSAHRYLALNNPRSRCCQSYKKRPLLDPFWTREAMHTPFTLAPLIQPDELGSETITAVLLHGELFISHPVSLRFIDDLHKRQQRIVSISAQRRDRCSCLI